MYKISNQVIPQNKRKEINEKIIYLLDNPKALQNSKITPEIVYNSYTGDGGLHGLEFNQFNSFHSFTEAKKQIENGQFFTPHLLSKFFIDCLKPSQHDIIGDLTAGIGNFANWLPTIQNVYLNELDVKAYKVMKFLYPDANITHGDIRDYNPNIKMDFVLGNPPYNIRIEENKNEYLSQFYYVLKADRLLKPAGILALIVPSSFLADDFKDGGMIKEMNNRFNYITQFELPSNVFKSVGVEHFQTKIMFFQKKSEHLTDRLYSLDKIQITAIDENNSRYIHTTYIKPVIEQKEKIKAKLFFENLNNSTDKQDQDFQFKVRKLLYDIKRNPKINSHYAKATELITQLKEQKKPDGMEYTEWCKVMLTPNKVLGRLQRIVKNQHNKEQDLIRLVKDKNGLRLKGYSQKNKIFLSKFTGVREISFVDMVLNNSYPFEDQTYRKLVNRKIRDYEKQSQSFKEMNEEQNIKMFLNELVIYNHNTNEEIKLNELQKHDTNLMLQKKYGYLQWQQGSGKSISATAQMLYRFKHNNIKNVFLVAPAIAIKNNWAKILEHYKLPHRQINKLSDVYNIKHGEIVFMTFGMLTKYERFIKKYVTLNNSNIMFVLDEADNISSLDSKRTKSTLSTFKKSKYKLLLSGTSTRNTIDESFTAFNLLYSQSVNMLCEAEYIYVEDKKTKEIEEKYNHDYYMKPFPAYKKGHTLFKRCFVPEKSTVFGIGKTDQNIYSSDKLKKLIDKTFITRSFQEVAGKDLYKIVQNTCTFNSDEKALYKVIIEEFYKIVGMYRSTGNYRKDAILRILRQLNALLLSASLPTAFKEYRGHSTPSKAKKMIQMVKQWDNEIVSIGCTRIKTVNAYANILRKHFPHRQIFVITGESSTLQQRQDIVDKLKESKNGILICTQQSLSSSMNIDFVNRVLLVELNWNMSQMSQHFFRYIRFTSKDPKEIHFLTVANSLESNLLKLNMTKEKLNLFMKDQEIDDEELNNRFGLDFDVLEWLLSKEKDSEGNTLIRWGEQKIV
jgi:hypothetical protein